jgi:hypothetical protein
MRYSVKSQHAASKCLDCNEPIRGKKRFCDDQCKIHWLETHHPWHADWRGVIQVENERKRHGVTPESLEWKRKRNVGQPFDALRTFA